MSETVAKDSEWASRSASLSLATSEPTYGLRGREMTGAASRSSSNRSVLIVEDDRAARTAIARLLKRLDFAVSEAATVAEAIDALSNPPAWILLDLMLPDGCGITVLRQVIAKKLATRVCIITGCHSELLAEAHNAGAEHTFLKPLDVDRLLQVMTAAD